MPYSLKKLYLKDAWKLVEGLLENPKYLTTALFNYLALCHLSIDELQVAEEKVLPLMIEKGFKPD